MAYQRNLGCIRDPAWHNPYLPAWLSSSTSCSGLLGLLCGSRVLGDAGCGEDAAGSPWPPLRAVGFSCQVSPTLAATFFSSEPAKVLRKSKYHYGASASEPVRLHSRPADVTSCGHRGLLFQKVGKRRAQYGAHHTESLCPLWNDPSTTSPPPTDKSYPHSH